MINMNRLGLALVLVVPLLFTVPLQADDQPKREQKTVVFEARLSSRTAVEGWKPVFAPAISSDLIIWISPEPSLTNADVARAWPDLSLGEFCVGLELTEAGALKLATLTREHVGEMVALMIDGQVTAAPFIVSPISGGRAILEGHFTEEEAKTIAEGIAGN